MDKDEVESIRPKKDKIEGIALMADIRGRLRKAVTGKGRMNGLLD